MIEQLPVHGVETFDLSPSLLKSAKIKNPLAESSAVSINSGSTTTLTAPQDLHDETKHNFDIKNPDEIKGQATLEIDVRWTVLCDLFLVLIADSIYDSRSRTLMEGVGNALHVGWLEIAEFERKVTDALEIEEGSMQTWNEEVILESRRKESRKKKYMYIGLATLGGGLVLGLSAGLLAPVIGAGLAAGFTTIGVTGTAGFLAGAGGAAVVTTTGAAVGARIGSKGMAKRMGHVRTFEFRPLHNNKRVNLIITVSGWMSGKEDDVRLPFSTVDPIMGDLFSVLWEPEMLQSMGQTINILATEVLTQSVQQVLGQTVLVALMASLQWPMALSKLGYILDNPWSVSLDRAWASGLILADTLINRNLGVRPVTLVGFSLGARVIYSCLVELARQGGYGLIQDVYIFGSPVVVKKDQFTLARSVVSGRFVNGYSKKDWILGYLFRATSGGLGRIAGLAAVNSVPNIENFDTTDSVEGHMGYRKALPHLLNELGWQVLSEDFAEIEDPDPDKHRERQKKLIEEFDEARKQMEDAASSSTKKSKKGKLFSWMKPKKKEWWEMYDREIESNKKEPDIDGETGTGSTSSLPSTTGSAKDSIGDGSQGDSVMFDLDAIRKEVKKLEEAQKGSILSAKQPSSATMEYEFEEYDEPNMTFEPFEDDEAERRGRPFGYSDENEFGQSASSSGINHEKLSMPKNGQSSSVEYHVDPVPTVAANPMSSQSRFRKQTPPPIYSSKPTCSQTNPSGSSTPSAPPAPAPSDPAPPAPPAPAPSTPSAPPAYNYDDEYDLGGSEEVTMTFD